MRERCIEVTQAIQTDRSRFLLRTSKSGTSPLGSDLKTYKKNNILSDQLDYFSNNFYGRGFECSTFEFYRRVMFLVLENLPVNVQFFTE
jgi:hypothetical protein